MKYANTIPNVPTVIYTAPSGEETEIKSLHVSCANVAGASFYLKYVPKNGGQLYMTPKLFTPPQLSTWDYPGLPFKMQPGDSIHASASNGDNYDLLLD